ncbi:MAG TPA: EAL domain-containing protein [Acidobacteriaceae bacterium]
METLNPSNPAFTFAFQPIVDAATRCAWSQEALIRGASNEPAYQILQQVPPEHFHQFDQQARLKAIELAASLEIGCNLNLNFPPQCLHLFPGSILEILKAARVVNLSAERIVLEVTEQEAIRDPADFAGLINEYRGYGLRLAIDDFGAGSSGLNLLADFQPDQIKLDMKLVRNIDRNGPRQAIVRAVLQVCLDLGIDVIAEGIETAEEYSWLAREGVQYYQGYLFARPAFEAFATVHYPDLS